MTVKNTGTDTREQDMTEKIGFLQFGAVEDALTAASGSDQASGYALAAQMSRFTTSATGGDSATLPPAKAGMIRIVCNSASANAMDVFPAVGEYINAIAQDGAFSIVANKVAIFFCFVDGKWNSILTA